MENEELNKSIDSLIEELFAEPVEQVEKSIDIAKDSETTADAAVNKAPKGQKDEDRKAGRPKQIQDVPQKDEDGKRAKDYDKDIRENENKEHENDEPKKQAPSIDQNSSGKGRIKKSEEISDEEWAEFQAFKKSQAEAAEEAEKLQKADEEKSQYESLVKAEVESAISPLREQNAELRKAFEEQTELLKAFAATPSQPKSITGIEALEKSVQPDEGPQTFSKSEMLDAAEDLFKSGSLSENDVIELDNTGSILDPQKRALIERKLQG